MVDNRLRRPALKAIRWGFRGLLGHLWATRNETVQEDRLPTVAALYGVHVVAWCASKCLVRCVDYCRTVDGVRSAVASRVNVASRESYSIRHFGLWISRGEGWVTAAELARELRR